MGPTGYTAAGKRCGPIHDGAYCLKEEPEAGEQHRRNLEEERYEENQDQDNDTREREKSHVTTEYPGNRSRGAQRRNSGVRVQYRVGYRRQYPAGEIKREITSRAELVLDRSPEQPQGPHIDDQVQPTAMQKHIADEGQIIGQRQRAVEHTGVEVPCRDQGEAVQELVELRWTKAYLEQKDDSVRCDQRPSGDREVAQRNAVCDRKHHVARSAVTSATGRRGIVFRSAPSRHPGKPIRGLDSAIRAFTSAFN